MLKKRLLILCLAGGSAVLLDRITKVWAVNSLKGEPSTSYWDDFFRLVYAENTGAFLSLGSGLDDNWRTIILSILPIIVLVYVLYFILFSKNMDTWQAIAFSLILGGGASNIFDRIMQGMVVDFMNMGLFGVRTGIFNVADMAIMAGLFMMLFAMFRNKA
jgi:signal peptidase II